MKKIVLLIFTLFISIVSLVGCYYTPSEVVSVVSIVKTSSNGLKDTYTITYSNGTISFLEIENGKNGEDGDSINIDDLYNKYLEIYPDITYEEFIKKILDDDVDKNALAIHKSLQSSAKIYAEFTESYKLGLMNTPYETTLNLGSSVIYKIEEDFTYFITNYHMVYNKNAIEENKIAKKIVCYLYGSEGGPVSTNTQDELGCQIYNYGKYAIECEYVGGIITADIAIIRATTESVKAINPEVSQIEFADDYYVGQTAIAIGNPEGEGISVTQGIVSVDNEYIYLGFDNTVRSYRSIRIDTSIYHGSSGGGLFDEKGKLIGITNAGDGNDQNVNYAIPLKIVKHAAENIMYYASINEAYSKKITVGIEVESINSKYIYNSELGRGEIFETIIIRNVVQNSIAEKLGLLVDDEILEITVNDNIYTIKRNFNISDVLLTIRKGDIVSFTVNRDDKKTKTNSYIIVENDLNQI